MVDWGLFLSQQNFISVFDLFVDKYADLYNERKKTRLARLCAKMAINSNTVNYVIKMHVTNIFKKIK